jgi:hypothetical protein
MHRRNSAIVGALLVAGLGTSGTALAGPTAAPAGRATGVERVTFTDVTAQAGVGTRASLGNGLASGSAWGDFDGDGFPDLFVGNHYDTPVLYHNRRDGTFEAVTSRVMVKPSPIVGAKWGDQHGAAWADVDNDGKLDLVVLVGAQEGRGDGPNQLFMNVGGKLTDNAAAVGLAYSSSRARTPLWFDYDNDGRLDLFQGAKKRPDGLAPPTLFRQSGGTFTDVRDQVGFLPVNTLSGWTSDLNRDGRTDLLYQGDRLLTPSAAFWTRLDIIDTTGTQFRDAAPISFRSSFSDVAAADYDGDLRPDLFIGNYWASSQTPVGHDLYLNKASGFVRVTGPARAAINTFSRPSPPSVIAADFDNDMDVDVFLDGGTPGMALANTILWNRGDGTFIADGAAAGAIGRQSGGADSASTADYDRDGFIDIYLTYNRADTQLYRNQGNTNHWLELNLTGTRSNRDGIGAQVYVTAGGKTQLREQTGGVHRYWSQNDQSVHFGLGPNTTATDVTIKWPSGQTQELTDVPSDQVLRVTEP